MAIDLSNLNEQQRTAVLESIDHNVVLLAAAGSGKTATLVKRTEYLIQECNVSPENIMLITFTNKAAKEIVSRIAKVTPEAGKMWIGTFHHICTRLLRRFGNVMGINNFSIIDTKEATKILTEIYTDNYGEVDKGTIKKYRKKISYYKSNLVNPASVLQKCDTGEESYRFAGVYQEYQNKCWRNKTFDFDDLIIYTILLLNSYSQVKQWVSENIKYVMIDETQDTGTDQYTLVRLLVGDNNIMAVGDVNQSIYGFRNAKPEYLNQFANLFPNTKLLKLETNYRSTNTIISAANAVINNNTFGEKINMVSVNEMGAKIGLKTFGLYYPNAEEAEASWICSEIQALVNNGKGYGDFAIINRTNVQNKDIEKTFIKSGIPYVIVGSSSFWSSTEMRDLLAYCKVVFNPFDDISFKRVLGVTRGVGKTTQEKILKYQTDNGLDCHEVIEHIFTNDPMVLKGVSKKAIAELNSLQAIFNKKYKRCSDLAQYIISSSGYTYEIRNEFSDEANEKMESLRAIVTSFQEYESNGDTPEEVIDQVSLMSDAKGEEKASLNAVKIMTAHAFKGLEFDTVFIGGVEEGLFPHWNALNADDKDSAIEEERRLFYVAMTRAKKKLYITYCRKRKGDAVGASRFLSEIPVYLTEECF